MKKIINVDLADVYTKPKEGEYITTLALGDEVEIIESDKEDYVIIKAIGFVEKSDGSIEPMEEPGYIKKKKGGANILADKEDNPVLKVDFVDVQQGDGTAIETPDGKVILIDGGDNQLFARYLANRFRGTAESNPKVIDCIIISHGDADHFKGLTEIYKSQEYDKDGKKHMEWKRLFIYPKRVYHNGLVKRPASINNVKVETKDMFGESKFVGDKLIITELVNDIRDVDPKVMNEPFADWQNALNEFAKCGDIESRRLFKGENDAFDFLKDENIDVEVLGPIMTQVNGTCGLEYLVKPPKDDIYVKDGQSSETDETHSHSYSASHTINGHSVVLKIKYGNVSFLFPGDLNEQSEDTLTAEHKNNNINLKAEIFKVPHHGSKEFKSRFIEAVNPLVSVISSGDENAKKEYIHPRATLVAALGKYSREEMPVIFVTELVAFFNTVGNTIPEYHHKSDGEWVEVKKKKPEFYAFKRTAFGIVKVRTNGKRLLVYTNSGQDKMKEAYAYEIEADGKVNAAEIVKV
jgi:beta-lactamase superfamily II metal-dependent hydrolase